MRAWFVSLLSEEQPLVDIVEDRIYQANSQPEKPIAPYIVYRMGPDSPRIALAKTTQLQVWFHDRPTNYTRIDTMMDITQGLLTSQPNKGKFFEASWIDDSQDLIDDADGTFVRFSRYQLVRLR